MIGSNGRLPDGNPRPFEISHYKATTYQKCPRAYYFEYLDPEIVPIKRQLKKPRPELEVGNTVHLTLFNYFKEPSSERSFITLKRILDRVWKPPQGERYGFVSIEEERRWYREALMMLKIFYEQQSDTQHLFYVPDPQSREEIIKIPLDTDLVLMGKVDRIDELADGLHVIDYKTGKSQNDDDFQIMTYVILAKQRFGKTVKKASYFYLRTGSWKTYSPSAGDEQVTAEKFRRVVKTIKADELFQPKPSRLCGWCDYLEVCPAKLEALEYINGTKVEVASFEEEGSGR